MPCSLAKQLRWNEMEICKLLVVRRVNVYIVGRFPKETRNHLRVCKFRDRPHFPSTSFSLSLVHKRDECAMLKTEAILPLPRGDDP